ncbi:MAG: trigger factor [Chloroflexota bacterium]
MPRGVRVQLPPSPLWPAGPAAIASTTILHFRPGYIPGRDTTLKVETQDLEDRQLRMTVEVPDDRLAAAMRSAARKLGSKTHIPGFRPGKAPYEILLSRFGEETVFEEAIEGLGQEVYRQALETASVEPFAAGSLDEVVSRAPLVLRYTVPLPPKVDLGSYRDLRLPFESPAVSDEAVQAFLEELRQSQALIEPADRPAQLSDVVAIDIRGELLPKEGENPQTLLNQQQAPVLITQDLDWPVPGASAHLVGLKAGEEREFEYTFPDDYRTESLRGRTARFHLTCREVRSRTVPEWSDDLARNLGEFSDLHDLRLKVRQSLENEARRRAEGEHADQVVQHVVDAAQVSFPPQLVAEELDDMLKDLDFRLRSQKLGLAEYLRIEKKSEEDLRRELEPRARERIRRALVLSEVVEVEGLEAPDEEIQAELDRMVAEAKEKGENIRKVFDHPTGRKRIAVNLLTQKAIQRLVAIARGEVASSAPSETTAPQDTQE